MQGLSFTDTSNFTLYSYTHITHDERLKADSFFFFLAQRLICSFLAINIKFHHHNYNTGSVAKALKQRLVHHMGGVGVIWASAFIKITQVFFQCSGRTGEQRLNMQLRFTKAKSNHCTVIIFM